MDRLQHEEHLGLVDRAAVVGVVTEIYISFISDLPHSHPDNADDDDEFLNDDNELFPS